MHVNIFKIYMYICMCVYLYIHNKYTQYTHIYHVNKNFYFDAINRLTALVYILIIFIYDIKYKNITI